MPALHWTMPVSSWTMLPEVKWAKPANRWPAAHLDDAALTARLRGRAAEALLILLEAHAFNQSAVAAALGTSRTTLIKLMDDLDLPRAADLDPGEIERARAQAGGDLDAAARILRVSPSALKKRVTLSNLKGRS